MSLMLLLLTAALCGCNAGRSASDAGRSATNVTVIDSIVLHDGSRERDIPLKIYLPAQAARVPLLIFSHGFGGSKDGYVYLAQAWADAGYAVILPTHHGGDRAALAAKGFGAVRTGDAVSTSQLQDNARDVSFIISSLDDIARRVPRTKEIDRKRIGVGGHSMGAGTALVLDGATLPGRSTSVTDARVAAFIALSPQGMFSAADAHRWDGIARPTMTIYGSNDLGAQGQPSTWRRDPFEHMRPGDKFNLIVEGANHFSFADEPQSPIVAQLLSRGQTRDISQIHEQVASATLLFWDAYLRHSTRAKAALEQLATAKK